MCKKRRFKTRFRARRKPYGLKSKSTCALESWIKGKLYDFAGVSKSSKRFKDKQEIIKELVKYED